MATQYTAGLSSGQVLTAATMNSIGAAWETWTPALTASTTNPNLGTTGTITGRYGRINKTYYGIAQFTFGGTGISAGTGFYYVSTPATAQAAGPVVGSWFGFDSSGGVVATGVLVLDTTDKFIFYRSGTGGGQYLVAAGVPWTWASGDFMRMNFQFEAA